jgi:type II secretory pathway component PulJ
MYWVLFAMIVFITIRYEQKTSDMSAHIEALEDRIAELEPDCDF